MKRNLLLVSLLLSLCSMAQTDIKTATDNPFIEVVGTAIREVIPDKIFITISLSDKVINNEKYTLAAQDEKLKTTLKKIGINVSQLVLSDASSEITRNKQKETGFKVTKEYTLQVKNATEVSTVFKELYVINIKEISIAKVEHSQIDSLRKEVRIEAIKAAKEKATYLLAAIGEEPGKPLEVHEQNDPSFFSNARTANSTLYPPLSNLQDDETSTNETSFKKLEIRFSYYIKYAIK